MREDPSDPVGFWQELRRRRVVRLAVAYVAVMFVVLQVTDIAVLGLGLPRWSFRVALGLAVLGFPFAIVLAWDFDVTSRGIVKTPEDATSDPTYVPGPPWGWLLLVSGATVGGVALWVLRS